MSLSASLAQPANLPAEEPRLGRIPPAEWAEVLAGFRDATVYQTHAYGDVSWGATQVSHAVVRREGQPIGAAQVRVVRVPLSPLGVAYVRWGPLWRRPGAAEDLGALGQTLRVLREEYVERRGFLLRVLPHVEQGSPVAAGVLAELQRQGLHPIPRPAAYRTFRIDLTPPLDVLRRRLDQKWRNQLNRAEKNGLEVREGEGEDLYQVFLKLYDEMYERKDFSTSVDPRDFGRIQAHLLPREKLRVLICLKDGQPLSALVGSTIGGTGIYLLGATSNEGMKHKGSYLLQWRLLQWLKEHGCDQYDLGGINPDENPGVHHFKKGMSGEDVRLLGTFQASRGRASALVVRCAEGMQRRLHGLRGALRRRRPAPAQPPTPSTHPGVET